MIFKPEELEELRRADAEIEGSYRLTNDDILESRKRDREAVLARKDNKGRKIAAYQAAYREANREKYNAYMREYKKANREKYTAQKAAWVERNREKWNAYMREYRRRKRAASRSGNPESGRE